MKVERSATVKDLQDSFVKLYPFLSLRVYNKSHDHNEGSPSSAEVGGSVKLEEVNSDLQPGQIVISDSLTVDKLETIFQNKFGLSVQIFRKSGNQWLQTTSTDQWTLQRQNSTAEEYEDFVNAG